MAARAAGAPSPPGRPSAVQIREANAHLGALHARVAELERRLEAAEETVRGQAGSLIRKDDEMRRALQGLRHAKDREIAALQEQLGRAEEKARRLLGAVQEKDGLITRLRHRSRLLTKICRSRPALDHLLAYMAEGERLSPVPGGPAGADSPDSPLPALEENCIPDLDLGGPKDFSLGAEEEDDEEEDDDRRDPNKTLFGTTV